MEINEVKKSKKQIKDMWKKMGFDVDVIERSTEEGYPSGWTEIHPKNKKEFMKKFGVSHATMINEGTLMKDDITKRINRVLNEIFPVLFAGVQTGRAAMAPTGAGAMSPKLKEMIGKVAYHQEKDKKKAVELVIKEYDLDKKTAKALRKFYKKFG